METVAAFLKRRGDLFQSLSLRQMEVLEQAARVGYLLDINPLVSELRPSNHARRFVHGMPMFDEDVACWPTRQPLAAEELEPWHDLNHQAGMDFIIDPIAAGPPRHYAVWEQYCCQVLQRPALTVGKFTPAHFLSPYDFSAIRVHSTDDDCSWFNFPPDGWAHLAEIAFGSQVGSSYLRYHWVTLTVEFWRADPEALARTLHDIISEHLQPALPWPEVSPLTGQ